MWEEHLHILDGALYHALIFLGLAFLLGHVVWRRFIDARGHPDGIEGTFVIAGACMVGLGPLLGLLQGIAIMELEYRPSDAWLVMAHTMFGRTLVVQGALAYLVVSMRLADWWRASGGRTGTTDTLLLMVAGAALVALTALGHASRNGLLSWPMLTQSLHIISAALWTAGLLLVMERLVRRQWGRLGLHLRRFSRLALISFLFLVPAGVARAWANLNGLSDLTTPYGAALALKLVFVLGVLGVAAGHHVWRLPALQPDPVPDTMWVGMDRWVMLEVFLVLMVILLSTLLAQLPLPGYDLF